MRPSSWNDLDPLIAARLDRAVGPLVRVELIRRAAQVRRRLDLGHEQGARDRRIQRRDQHAMIAAGVRAGDGAAGITARAVGHQPFAPHGIFQIAADVASEVRS